MRIGVGITKIAPTVDRSKVRIMRKLYKRLALWILIPPSVFVATYHGVDTALMNDTYVPAEEQMIAVPSRRYFAYGSNMSTAYLTNIRGVYPLDRESAKLSGYKLNFSLRGPNWIEPGFANIAPADDAFVEGVVYTLDEAAYERVVLSEPEEYRQVTVDVVTPAGKTIQAITLVGPDQGEFQPSKRYLKTLVKGAQENELSATYIASLHAIDSVYVPLLSEAMGSVIYLYVYLQSTKAKSAAESA